MPIYGGFLPLAGGTLTGALVGTSASFSGALTAASFNGNTFTTGSGTLTLGAAKTFTASNTLTLTATDGSTLAIGAGGTLGSNAYTSTAYLPLAGGTMVGDLLFTDGLYDIGKSAATRPRNIFASGTGTFGGLLTANLGITVPNGQAVTIGTGGLTSAQSGTTGTSLGQNTASTIAASGSAGVIGFVPSASNVSAALDTAFSRSGAGIVALGTGAFGSVAGTLSLTNLTYAVAGKETIGSGTNQRAGNAVLVGGTVTVSNTTVTANTLVLLTRKTSGGTIGTAITYTLSAGTSFTINSDSVIDTSTFSYLLIEVV